MKDDGEHREVSPEEHARLNPEFRSNIEKERRAEAKDSARNWFTAILVLISLFVVGGALYGLLPEPFNIIALLGLAMLWYYIYESN